MRSLVLALVLGGVALGLVALTPAEAQAWGWRQGYVTSGYYGPAYSYYTPGYSYYAPGYRSYSYYYPGYTTYSWPGYRYYAGPTYYTPSYSSFYYYPGTYSGWGY